MCICEWEDVKEYEKNRCEMKLLFCEEKGKKYVEKNGKHIGNTAGDQILPYEDRDDTFFLPHPILLI